MELLFDTNLSCKPLVSIILLDWCCRESFHSLDYLSDQTIPREQYEIIWIEYYNRRSPEIEAALKKCEKLGKPPVVDKWIVMGMSDTIYYHKHLMYNLGTVASKGEIVIFCDSDAIFRPSFIESVIKAFEEDKNIVLHVDEVRSVAKKYYPFNYPSIDEILNNKCINWKDGRTTGLWDKEDPLHTLNYGACMCALREDIINIGGADEHIDYLGHVCGPYEMTFRLVNAGKKEIWHQEEFLYHVWHPGTDGHNNYLGPHDGRNMSSPALEARRTGRINPLVENPAIRMLRTKQDTGITKESLFSSVVQEDEIKNWTISEEKRLVSLGRAAYYRREYDKAIQCWGKVWKNISSDATLLSDIGWAYYFKSNHNEALNIFNEAIKLDQNNQGALRGRGWTNYCKGSLDEAIRDFSNALHHINPHDKNFLQETYRGRGWAYFHKGCIDEALQDFMKATENTTSDNKGDLQDLFRGIGWAYMRKGNFEQSKTYFDRALENISPQDKVTLEDALRGRDMAYNALLDEVSHIETDAEGFQCIKSGLFCDKGWMYYGKSEYKKALKAFDKATTLDRKNQRAFYSRGWTYLQMGYFDEAIQDFNKAIEVDTTMDKIGLQQVFTGRGWAYYHKGDFNLAIEDFNRAVIENTNGNDNYMLRYTFRGRSWVYFRIGRLGKAVEDFKRSFVFPPSNPYIIKMYLIAMIIASRVKHRWMKMGYKFKKVFSVNQKRDVV